MWKEACAGREALKELKRKKNGNWELVIPICSAVTKTVYRDQNTNSLIVTIENYSFKCALLWQYSTGKANTSKFPSRWRCFIFPSFQKHRRAKWAHENERTTAPTTTTTPLLWWLINPLRFIFYHPRSTDFEEELEDLWTGYKFPGSYLLFYLKSINKA